MQSAITSTPATMGHPSEKYIIGETYWFKNPAAGRNMQSPGVLINWTDSGLAVLSSKRYGTIYATVENLDVHN